MPIAAIERTKLFGGHWVRHCFRPKYVLFITVFLKKVKRYIENCYRMLIFILETPPQEIVPSGNTFAAIVMRFLSSTLSVE